MPRPPSFRVISLGGLRGLCRVSRSGMDPNKDVTILAIGAGTPERLAAVVSGSVDATVITSPAEYPAEKQGLR